MTEPYRVRPGAPADFPGMADLMARSIRALGPERYTPEQVELWASAAHDGERFRAMVERGLILVAEDGSRLLGFGAITPTGYLTALYVHPEHVRRGIGSTLLTRLVEEARQSGVHRIHTEASDFARGLLIQAGFQPDAEETVRRKGVILRRARMTLSLSKRNPQ